MLFPLRSWFPSRPRDGAGKAAVQSCLSSIIRPPSRPWPSILSSFPTSSPSFSTHWALTNPFSKAVQGDLDPEECEQGGGCILSKFSLASGRARWGWGCLEKRRGRCGRIARGFVTPHFLLANCSILHFCLASPHMSETPQAPVCSH